MKTVWVIVADASRAYFYTFSKIDLDLPLIKKFYHPEAKLKEIEFGSDQPGHYQKGSYEPNTNAKERELEHFVKELCQELEHGRVSHAYTAIVIVAEPHLYGLIHRLASPHVHAMIKNHFAKDYAHLSEQDLRTTLRDTLVDTLKPLLFEED